MNHQLEQHEIIIAGLGVLTLLVLLYILWRLHQSKEYPEFDLVDLLMENGKASKFAIFLLGAFIATTWVLVYQTIHNALTEWLFAAYGAFWVVPVVTKLLNGAQDKTK